MFECFIIDEIIFFYVRFNFMCYNEVLCVCIDQGTKQYLLCRGSNDQSVYHDKSVSGLSRCIHFITSMLVYNE